MRKLFGSAIVLAILSGPAVAQKNDSEPLAILEKEKKQQHEAVDQQYKRTLDRTRKEADSNRADPWSNMRAPADNKR